MRPLDDLQSILSAAGKYTGTGVNHAAESFTGDLALQALEGGSAALLHYVATRTDGKHLHAETTLIACDALGELCLWPAMEELPHLLVHRLLSRDAIPAGTTRFVFSSGKRDDRTHFARSLFLKSRLAAEWLDTAIAGGCQAESSTSAPGAGFAERERQERSIDSRSDGDHGRLACRRPPGNDHEV